MRRYTVHKSFLIALSIPVLVLLIGVLGYHRTEDVYVDLMSGQLRRDVYIWGIPVNSQVEPTDFSEIVSQLSLAKSPPQWRWISQSRIGGVFCRSWEKDDRQYCKATVVFLRSISFKLAQMQRMSLSERTALVEVTLNLFQKGDLLALEKLNERLYVMWRQEADSRNQITIKEEE
jgi:hypothetical protein